MARKKLIPQLVTHCPDCGWVMPMAPHQSMKWCPCGWPKEEK